jgi:hypothetical protein
LYSQLRLYTVAAAQRTYNFIEVCGWFAARCDLILLLFDPAKLDISDEMKQVAAPAGGTCLAHVQHWAMQKDEAGCNDLQLKHGFGILGLLIVSLFKKAIMMHLAYHPGSLQGRCLLESFGLALGRSGEASCWLGSARSELASGGMPCARRSYRA